MFEELKAKAERIPADLRADVLGVIEFAEMTVDVTAKDAERRIHDVKFFEAEIRTLIVAIRSAADLTSLRATANETIKRIQRRTYEREQQRLRS